MHDLFGYRLSRPQRRRFARLAVSFAAVSAFAGAAAQAQVSSPVNVATYHNDNARTGANLNETLLSPRSLVAGRFGLLYSFPVDGPVHAQPLYLSKVNMSVSSPGAPNIRPRGAQIATYRNLVFIATENNSVYAFDANQNASPIWHVNFGAPDARNGVGIDGTPVIDPSSGTLYLVSRTAQGRGAFTPQLHALDIRTGSEKFGGPVVISAAAPGTGDGTDGQGNVPFDTAAHRQRAALLLSNGVVYIGWASFGDQGPYHGWLMGYNAQTLQQVSVFNTTPNAVTTTVDGSRVPAAGAIWMAGGGPAADTAGNLFFTTGNGSFDPTTAAYGDSFVKMSAANNSLAIADYFTPFDQLAMNDEDADLGSGGVLLLPDAFGVTSGHRRVMVSAGKTSRLYLVDRDSLGHNSPTIDPVVAEISWGAPNWCYGTPAYFNRTIYVGGSNESVHAYSFRPFFAESFDASKVTDLGAVIVLNGAAQIDSKTKIQLTNGAVQTTSSAYWPNRVNVKTFRTTFQFQFSDANAAGITFLLQNNLSRTVVPVNPNNAFGDPPPPPTEAGLGYEGIGASVAVKFEKGDNLGNNKNTTGLYINGVHPAGADTDLTAAGINFASGDVFQAELNYDGRFLTVTIQDTGSGAIATQFYQVDIPGTLRNNIALAGFTASTNDTAPSGTPKTEILTWKYLSKIGYGKALIETAVSPANIVHESSSVSISANQNSNGIVWLVTGSTSNWPYGNAVLYAYDAATLKLLYSSLASGDSPSGWLNFTIPTIANGKVFVGTADRVNVYGLRNSVQNPSF